MMQLPQQHQGDVPGTLKLTASLHLKMDGWNTFSFPFGMAYFQVRTVSFREGKLAKVKQTKYLGESEV